jgi:lycopene beta-cyclase
MDFRCDQSLGMHFIYCLPFTDRHALIESTLFSPELAPTKFYEDAIQSYLHRVCGSQAYKVIRQETGVIPLGALGRHDPTLDGIGGNGGAIRPSSGYVFSFIQKQVNYTVAQAAGQAPLPVRPPHSTFELWMDCIFMAVLRRYPELAPMIFTRMATALNADEFALFLSGEAGIKLWLRVVMAMPKTPFIWGLFHPEPRRVIQ